MSKEGIQRFRAALANDAGLRDQVRKAKSADALVALAAGLGFEFTAHELLDELDSTALTEVELEAVAGGAGDC